MVKLALKMFSTACLFVLSYSASASLIVNGSFEQTKFDDSSIERGLVFNTDLQTFQTKTSAWDVFAELPGWRTSFGSGIELQKNVVTQSQDGNHHVELDAHPRGSSNSVMTQTIDSLTVGASYLLEFYYKPRTSNMNDNGINVFWYDAGLEFNNSMQVDFVADGSKKQIKDWVLKSVVFTAEAESMDLSFGSFGRQNTLGGLIDNVSLTAVPEPAVFSLLFVGLGVLFVRRKQVK